jgi:hypothetical protein
LYKLAREQLSKQNHYDFGLRTLKATLVMAGELKRTSQDLPENVMLMRTIRYVFLREGSMTAVYVCRMVLRLIELGCSDYVPGHHHGCNTGDTG